MTTPAPTASLRECEDEELIAELRRRGWERPSRELQTSVSADQLVRVLVIQKIVADDFSIETKEMTRPGRGTQHVALTRQCAMWLTRQLTPLTFAQIGSVFGGRDHGTARYAAEEVERRRQADPEVCARLADLRTALERIYP